MKILFLNGGNTAGGAERVMTILANYTVETNQDVTFVQLDKDSSFYHLEKRMHHVYIGSKVGQTKNIVEKLWARVLCYQGLLKILKDVRPDVVISFLGLPNRLGCVCCHKQNIPIIISERNYPLFQYNKTWDRVATNLSYPKANGVVCQSEGARKQFIKKFGDKNVTIIVNPLTKDQMTEKATSRVNNIISVGRLAAQKNHKLLIQAYSELPDIVRNYKLIIYGEGTLRPELEKMVKDLGMEDRIFLPGVEKEAIKKHNNASLFVMPSLFEGYPNVLVEAMANGLPVVASDIAPGTVSQIVKDGYNGWIFPVNDKEALKEKMCSALSDKEALEQIAERGMEIRKEIPIEKIGPQWMHFIHQIISAEHSA